MPAIKEKQAPSSLIERMFASGAHYGFSKRRRHPSYQGALFGLKNTIDIIDLEKTCSYLARALEFVKTCGKEGKIILFLGTKPEAAKAIEKSARALAMPFVTFRWIGGMLTNFSEIKKRIARLEELRDKKDKGELAVYTKKERMQIDEEILDLEKNFNGILPLKRPPHAIFVVDPRFEDTAVREAKRLAIPLIALAGSDCDISKIDYPIPANDSSKASIEFFVQQIEEAYGEGKKEQSKKIEDEKEGVKKGEESSTNN